MRQSEQWTHPVPHTPREDQCDRESSGHTPCHTLPAQKAKRISATEKAVATHRATRFPRSRSVRKREQRLATLGATHSTHNRRRKDCSCSKNQPAAERARTHYTTQSTQSRLSLITCPPANQFNGHCVEQVLSPHECIMVGRSSKRPQVHW